MADLKGFDHCKLANVQVTDTVLGKGAYAIVLKLYYNGLECAGKKIHETLLQGASIISAFERECGILSKLRHPNIVQFLGVHFEPGAKSPILVMEYLPTNLTTCIEDHGILPKEEIYSILYDVVLGLHYLHSQTPPIIHRDLTSNNVLLTCSMRAKISDLGTARILNLKGIDNLSIAPGTQSYMPPEALVDAPQYDTCIDVFSYGILMIHILCGTCPHPQCIEDSITAHKRMPVSEAYKRKHYLEMIGYDHPLMHLVLKCIHNYPRQRANCEEILEIVGSMAQQYPRMQECKNQLDMLKRIRLLQDEVHAIKDEAKIKDDTMLKTLSQLEKQENTIQSIIQSQATEKEALITELEEIINSQNREHKEDTTLQELVHSTEVVKLKQEIAILTEEKTKQNELIGNMLKYQEEAEMKLKAKDETIKYREELRQEALDQLNKISTYLTTNKQVGK